MNISERKRKASIEKSGTRTSEQPSLLTLARAVGQGAIIAVITGAILSLLAAIMAYAGSDPDSLIMPLGLGALALSAIACGFGTWHKAHTSPLLCGTLGGLVLLFLLFFLPFDSSS